MHIVLILSVGIERPSGRRYFQIARQLVRRGHRVTILALHPDLESCPVRRFTQEGVTIWYVGQMHVRKRGSQVVRFGPLTLLRVLLFSTGGLLWGILSTPADLYHLGKPQPLNGMAATIGLRLRRRPFYLDCDDDEVASNRFTAGWQRTIFAFWQRHLPPRAQALTVNTHYLAALVATPGQRVVHVPNGVDLAQMAAPDATTVAGLRCALRLEGRRVLVYVGSLALQNHPVDLLLDAFAQLAPTWPNLTLLMVGGGDDLALLQQWTLDHDLADRILFTGQVAHTLVPYLLALGEMSVDPVHDDSVARARSPLKLFESMALGVPVVTADVGDRAELLNFGTAGLLVRPGDSHALAAGLSALLGDAARRAALGRAARAYVARYDWAQLAAQWETVYAAP